MQLAGPAPRRSRIALTSLVDVVFILLFFFMLASQHLQWRSFAVNRVAPVAAGAAEVMPDDTRTLLLLADGRLFVDGQGTDLDRLLNSLRGASAAPVLVLVPGPGVSMQALVDMLDALQPSGAALQLGRVEAAR